VGQTPTIDVGLLVAQNSTTVNVEAVTNAVDTSNSKFPAT